MSFTYDEAVPDDPVDFMQRRAQALAMKGTEGNPDNAARALKLSQVTGVPPAVVHSDLENFDADTRNTMTSQIIKGNPQLSDYVLSHPLAAELSNDDWSVLDSVSGKLKALRSAVPHPGSIAAATAQGFAEGYGDIRPGSSWYDPSFFKGGYELMGAVLTVAGLPVEAFIKAGSGLVHGVKGGVTEGMKQFGAADNTAESVGREAAAMAEWAMMRGDINLGHPELAKAAKDFEKVGPYLKEGKEPPVGIHPDIDMLKAEQAKSDVKTLDELLSEAQASTTRERDPQMFARFVQQHTNATIAIDAEAVLKMYGDKVPLAEDGKLGFVPRLEDQLKLSAMGGGDIVVPLSDWLAHVDPKIAKDLHDDIRVRSGGVTLNEIKVNKEYDQAIAGMGEVPSSGDPAVDAIRAMAKLEPVRIATESSDIGKLFGEEIPKGGSDLEFSPSVTASARDKGDLQAGERQLVEKVNSIIERVAGKDVLKAPVDEIRVNQQGQTRGAYIEYDNVKPVIAWAIGGEHPEWTGRHEALHHLRAHNFFKPEEWSVLERAARSEGWKDKHNIEERYAPLSEANKLEEAIADHFGEWATGKVEVSGRLAQVFEKIKAFLEEIKTALREILGKDPTWEDVFKRAESGEVAKRGAGEPRTPGAKDIRFDTDEQLSHPDLTRIEDREVFDKAAAIGMTADQYRRFMRLIERRAEEDAKAQLAAQVADETRRQSAEWKENRAKVIEEVKDSFRDRPDVAADEFFRQGRYGDQKLSAKPKLDPQYLTPEERKLLPADYLAEGGLHPDDAANLFGYSTGSEMVARLNTLMSARKQSGLQPKAFYDKMILVEADRRMEAKYGSLEKNVLEEAKEHVLGETQLDLLHEETLALATKAGAELPINKAQLKSQVIAEFNKTPIENLSSDRYLASAGKSGRAAEMALLKGEFSEAFRNKQSQYLSVILAQQAKKLEKEIERFDKQAKTFSARDLSGKMPQEYGNFIHQILGQVGKPVKRTVGDLANAIEHGEYKSLEDFVAGKEADLREVPVADFLLDPKFKTEFEKLTAEEFRAVRDSVTALAKNGRDERKILKAGAEADLEVVKTQMKDQLKTFAELHYNAEGGRWLGPIPPNVAKGIRTYGVAHLQMESFLNRIERGDPRGAFSQYVMRDLISAANSEAAMRRTYSKRILELKDNVDLKERIPDSPFTDPFSGDPVQMTRKNLRAVLQNVGNASNLDKLARGYKVEPQAIMDWLYAHAKKEDWDWAQKQGRIFADLKVESDRMYRNLTGVEPTAIPLEPVQTPHEVYDGWYHPVVYHPLWEGSSKKLMGREALEEANYVRATTPQDYTKSRTGYAGPLALDLDATPNRIGQMIHDISMRPAVLNADKIFRDKEIRAEIAKRFGKEYRDLMGPYIRDVANAANFRSEAQKIGSQALEWFRQNVIASLIGFNPGTVMKHGSTALTNSITEVGPKNFLDATRSLLSINEKTGESNWKFAMRESEELQRRMQHYQETIGGAHERSMGEQSFRETVIRLGASPVAWSDLMSATPTWLAQFKKSMQEGLDHGEAVFMADRAVRRAHGSTAITSRPAVARGGALASWLSSLYGFFNHIMNRQYEMTWRANDAIKGIKTEGVGPGAAAIPALTVMLMSYVIVPAIVEELVTPLPEGKEHSNWAVKAAKALTFSVTGSWIGIRDFAHAALAGRDPQAGLMSTGFKSISDVTRDLGRGKEAFNKDHAGNLIMHATSMFGMLTGLTNASEGRVGKFLYDVKTGKERPRNPGEWWYGLRHGKSEKK